jgi:sigma-B regulation protein RsbU (phosphoserine phosphatase)
VESDIGSRLEAVERIYNGRFNESVEASNGYRKILYGWTLVLVIAIGVAGLQLLRLYKGLEDRVAQRTRELRQAMDALWGEMRLARKIQEALVPAAPAGLNCEIAASMRPSAEVGGDYYDVLQCNGRDWILIGDVSGHGVPAGLIMMMCHTAVRTVLQQNPEILPDKLLAAVNTVLTENIRQLGEDKYMTISAFRRDADGTVLFAGAHQDIHIYRADTDSVETLETEGIWLGIKHQIDEALVTRRFSLRPGDLFLLYTDGITEAKRDGALFDTSGVNEVLKRARGKTADEVLAELFAELNDFKINDDASVLIVKQLDSEPMAEQVSQTELALSG